MQKHFRVEATHVADRKATYLYVYVRSLYLYVNLVTCKRVSTSPGTSVTATSSTSSNRGNQTNHGDEDLKNFAVNVDVTEKTSEKAAVSTGA